VRWQFSEIALDALPKFIRISMTYLRKHFAENNSFPISDFSEPAKKPRDRKEIFFHHHLNSFSHFHEIDT
jgi:hypothetical protein